MIKKNLIKILFALNILIFINYNAFAEYKECINLPKENQNKMNILIKKIKNKEKLSNEEYDFYMENYDYGNNGFCYDKITKSFYANKNTENEISISKENYDFLVNNIELYKNYNYFIDTNKINTKNRKPCILGNFNQNNIVGINITWNDITKNDLDETIDLVSAYINYVDENDKEIKLNIADAQYYECKNINIKNCKGIDCLKQLPKDCYFLIKPNNDVCFSLKTNKLELMWIICGNEKCRRSESMVEFNVYD